MTTKEKVGEARTPVKFEVVFTPTRLQEIGHFLDHLDFGIKEVSMPVTHIFSWETSTTVDQKYIRKMAKACRASVETQKGILGNSFKVISVKYLKP